MSDSEAQAQEHASLPSTSIPAPPAISTVIHPDLSSKNHPQHEHHKTHASTNVWNVITYIPVRCRYHSHKPFEFSLELNILFGTSLINHPRSHKALSTNLSYSPASPSPLVVIVDYSLAFAGCITVANLYYNHPILNLLANDFGISYEEASYVPTLAQAGYAAGLLLLCPLGDLLRRRGFVILLVWATGTLW
jgi:hypothetical protein